MWEEAEKFLSKDRYISPLIEKYGHCTIKPRHKRYYYEDLVDAIVQQQLSLKAASAIFGRIKERINPMKDKVTNDHKWRVGRTIIAEMTPETILSLTDQELRKCGLSRAKTTYIRDLSSKVAGNQLDLTKLAGVPDKEVIDRLLSVKGIGEWTAHMFLMFTLGRPDVFPVGDLGLRNAFGKTVKSGLSRQHLERFAIRWKPYRTVASWYLWKSVE